MKNYFVLALRLVAAGILLQTLYFKFSGAPESKFIFATLGVEPWGRWFAGFSELVASVLLLWPRTSFLGALASIGIMGGAILSHILILGVVVQDDGGLLFGLALLVAGACSGILYLQREQAQVWLSRLGKMRLALAK